jgi:hypothetical protein
MAEKFGLQIPHVLLSHFQSDFVAGPLELRARCGATIHLGRRQSGIRIKWDVSEKHAIIPMTDPT